MTTAERLKKIREAEDTLYGAMRDHRLDCGCALCGSWLHLRRALRDITDPGFEILDYRAREVTP